MNHIKLLTNELINKIAAGEVIERPSSVVKELVENSLDANSSKIDIFIRNGGKTEIKIVDDGDGIPYSEIELSVKRHATSKLNFNNLEEINSLGFRGEALPSIASVSKMKIETKSRFDESQSEIFLNFGTLEYLKPTAKIYGTTITIKDIFLSTPARLKFLKSEKYENLMIKRILQKLALSNPVVEFNYFNNGKKIFSTKSYENILEVSLRKTVVDILGTDFDSNLVTLNQVFEKVRFRGLVGLPTFHHSNSLNQFTFVNKRIISDKSINGCIKAAYKDFQSYDRYPQVIIFIEIPFEDVDVNVHPAKNEVRFKNNSKIRSLLISSIRNSLSEAGHRASSINTERAVKSFYKSINYPKNNLNFWFNDFRNESMKTLGQNDLENVKHEYEFKNEENNYSLGYAKCQYHENYIISQTNDGLIIVDQHAAHERIVYEKLKKDYFSKKTETQILLIPEVIKLDSTIIPVVDIFIPKLEQYGLFLERFGKDSIVVREIPLILVNCNIKRMVEDAIAEISEIGETEVLETQINKICSSMACHGSIRSGREMNVDEMNKLLRDMESTPFSGQCNHGRPTYVELKIDDIEKLFGRK